MNADLDHLVELQAIDLELKQLRDELDRAPKRVAAAEQAFTKTEAALAAVRKALAEEEALRRRQELEIADRRQKIERLRRQMDSATSAAQIAALEHEIHFADDVIHRTEDEELASLERTEAHEALERSEKVKLQQAKELLEAERTRAAETKQRNSAAVTAREHERAALRTQIPDSLLANYDRVAKGRGTAIAEARDHKCLACQMMLRPQRWNDLTGRDHLDEIFTCETCGRMLFWDPRRDAPQQWAAGERLAAVLAAAPRA